MIKIDMKKPDKFCPLIDCADNGHWVWVWDRAKYGAYILQCDQCGEISPTQNGSNYCPNCGARMENISANFVRYYFSKTEEA